MWKRWRAGNARVTPGYSSRMGIFDREHHEEEHDVHKIVRLLESIDWRLERIEHAVIPHKPGPPVKVAVLIEGENMGSTSVPDNSGPVTATATTTDADGQPTTFQSPPTWTSSDESVATVDGSGDPSGLTAVVTPVGIGESDIVASTVNDDGTVVSSPPAAFTVTAGPPAAIDVEFS